MKNYEKCMESIIGQLKSTSKVHKLLLHSCCAPCSSSVIERLSDDFQITVFYYNPNIEPESEYRKRVQEEQRFLSEIETKYPISFIEGDYCTQDFHNAIKGKEHLGERSMRCYECYLLRLTKTAKKAAEGDFDFFTTTLSVSPYKNVQWLNEIGGELESKYNVSYLYSDFKKKNGYKRSIELSEKYHLYRQDFCGCSYSKQERMLQKEEVAKK